MRALSRIAVACALISAGVLRAAGAQSPLTCPRLMDSLARIPRPVIVDASQPTLVGRAMWCPDRGPAQIARLWAIHGLTESEVLEIMSLSRIADVRIADTLIAVARRASASPLERTAALTVLSQHITSLAPMSSGDLRKYGRSDTVYQADHGGSAPGGRPLTNGDRQRIIRTFSELSILSTSPDVQEAARGALRASAHGAPQFTTVPAETMTLAYVCGNRFRVVNRSAVEGDFTYDVSGSAARRTVYIRVAPSITSYSDLTFTAPQPGTVRLFWQNQLLQTTANGGTTCPK